MQQISTFSNGNLGEAFAFIKKCNQNPVKCHSHGQNCERIQLNLVWGRLKFKKETAACPTTSYSILVTDVSVFVFFFWMHSACLVCVFVCLCLCLCIFRNCITGLAGCVFAFVAAVAAMKVIVSKTYSLYRYRRSRSQLNYIQVIKLKS